MVRDQFIEAVLLQNIFKARHSHQAVPARYQIPCDGTEVAAGIRLVLQVIEGGKSVEGTVLKDLVLRLGIIFRDLQPRSPGFHYQIVLMLHPESLHRVIGEDLQEFSLAAAGLQDLSALQAAHADPVIILAPAQTVHRGGPAAGTDHVPVIGNRIIVQLDQTTSCARTEADRDTMLTLRVLRVRQILGCCRHIFYGKKRRLRKQSAAGNASFHKLSPVSVRTVFCPHSPDGKVKSRMHPVFAGASPGCLPGS